MNEVQNTINKISLKRKQLSIMQINMGNLCNHACSHCHIEASPVGENIMDYDTSVKVIEKLKKMNIENIEITGGTPEMNPNFRMFLEELGNVKKLTVRSSLTILNSSKYSHFKELYKKYHVKIIASLPSILEDITDTQRGKNYYKTSINVLKDLNEMGYGKTLPLDIVYNPAGDYLPPEQAILQNEFRNFLGENFGVSFNNLSAIVNVPIMRFRDYLVNNNRYDDYINLLFSNHNKATWQNVMCRSLLTVGHDGRIYDCDFNYALRIPVKGFEDVYFWDIDFDNFESEIIVGEHCLACTVNRGSSCHGELKNFDTEEVVKGYYGSTLSSSNDLKTTACCDLDDIPEYVKDISPLIADEIQMKFYGCGSPIPLHLEGCSVVDLGCGTGRDSYIVSKLAGEHGKVLGIDMTNEQIDIARKHINTQMKAFGYENKNVKFVHDYIENAAKHVSPGSADVVISNCVINLTEDKERVLDDIFRMLKNGGELYFSDIYADRRLPDEIRNNELLYAECLGGALYINDFIRLARKAGFNDPRIMTSREIEITNKKVQNLVGNARFYSVKYRLFKIDGLEDACEDYGHVAIYKGGLKYSENKFILDEEHVFEKNKPERVCGNTALMLSESRFRNYFTIIGVFDEHFGAFEDCGGKIQCKEHVDNTDKGCCC